MKDESNLSYFIAKPEKAVIDFIYLNIAAFNAGEEKQAVESYRFQNLESLDDKLLCQYSEVFGIKKLDQITGNLIKLMRGRK